MPVVKDEFTIHPTNGTIKIGMGGKRYQLRRPTLGELWRLRESVLEIAATKVDDDGDPVVLTPEERIEQENGVLDWWRDVIKTLDENGNTLPDSTDDVPAWLIGPMLIPESIAAWMSRPTVPGG